MDKKLAEQVHTPYCKQAPMCKTLCGNSDCVEQAEQEPIRFVWNGEGWIEADEYLWKTTPDAERRELYATPQPDMNLNCKSVQKRLATVWGYVKAEQAEQEPVAEALRLSEEAIEYARQGGKIGSGIYGKALAAIRSAKEPQITTPDVCGEVCVRAKLRYGCGKALDEANAKFTEQAEQEQFDMEDHPPHRLCECRKCMEYFTPLPDCDAFAAPGKPIAEQTNTQFMEGYRIGLAEMREKCAKVVTEHVPTCSPNWVSYVVAIRAIKFEGDTGFRPVSEMIAEHKQDPKKAAAIEKAKMRKAEQKPVTISCECGDIYERDSFGGRFIKLHGICPNCDAVPQAEQKPVAVVEITYGKEPECYVTGNIDDFPEGVFKLYAAPVRTKDLTDDEIVSVLEYYDHEWDETTFAIARAVIAKDREKNK